jgi:hypothetical protein
LASIPNTAALWVLKSMLAGDLLGWQSILARAWRIAEFCRLNHTGSTLEP